MLIAENNYQALGSGGKYDVDHIRKSDFVNEAKKYRGIKNKTAKGYTSYGGIWAYKTGGLADFTGPAWLDGTKSKPEYVLNAEQTKHFFNLIDVLDSLNKGNYSTEPSGDNYFEIEINVDSISNDYDVERMAEKIKSIIYEDATYRNVNVINHIR
jgi:hypothetical protein